MEWESFQQFVELFLGSRSTSFNNTTDQIELMIEGHSVICTRQEFDIVNNRCLSYTLAPTYLYTSKEIEIIADPIDNRISMRLPHEPITIGDDEVSYTLSSPSHELLLSFLSSIPKEEIRDYRRMIPARYILQRFELGETDTINLFDILLRVVRISYSLKIVSSGQMPVVA
ncbi:MAG: hypothetical protein IKN38_05530, partial [Clostridia bacterium]|nr:hypothetical protein [Clostridia bacterium]